VTQLGLSGPQFLQQLHDAVTINQLWVGLVKAPVFAFLTAMVGCYEGLKVSGSAESVGVHTTQAVVVAIFLVIVADAVFAILFNWLNI
jgi:phospholipid/cholesterol/gamma-HCH transport system permease protein